ncbi:hypothetical protein GGI22_004635, partial [Coemansia erecta]
NNVLVHLPPGFGRTFSKLQLLDVSGNQIAALPEDVGHLSCLRELNASRNALTGLPTTIGALRSLEVLNVAENYITSLDASVSRLGKLRMLNVSNNRLAHLPTCLGLLAQNLRILLVDGNPFDKSQRDLVEPILTISSRDAKKIAKAKEKEEKMRETATRNGEISGNAAETDYHSHSKEYASAVRKLMTVRLRRYRNPSIASALDTDTGHSATWLLDHSASVASNTCQSMHQLSRSNHGQLGTCGRADLPSTGIATEPAPPVLLDIAGCVVDGSNNDVLQGERELFDIPHKYQLRQSNATSGATAFTQRSSLSSVSQDSQKSSVDDALNLIQDATKVSRVLWHLCDEWDLDPRHSESDNVKSMVAQLQCGKVRIDGAAGIDRVYQVKSPNAGSSQRMKILSELLVTEVTYVDTLKNVVGVYLNPMREAKALSESELREIFSNIEVILAFHNDHFLPAITYAISNPEMAIGSVFLHLGAHLRLYSMYTNNHEASIKTLGSVSSRRSVSAFIQTARHDVTQIGQVGLDGHLLTPIQRLPRYRMLLTDLLSNTPVDHPDHETLYVALKELNQTIYEVNEKKRAFENQSQLQRIQEKVASSSEIPLVVPHRVFKLMANFRVQLFSEPSRNKKGGIKARRIGLGTVYRFFLFNDMIMQCAVIMNKDLRLNRVYKLDTRVAPAEVTRDNELRIIASEGILYLKGDHAEIRKWALEIN